MSRRRIFWLIATILVLVVFFSFIPVDVYEQHNIIYSLIGGVLFFLCLFRVMGNFESIYDIFNAESPEGRRSTRTLAVTAALLDIIVGVIFMASQSARKERELAAHGILTKGLVMGQYSKTTKYRRLIKNTSHSIQVSFVDSLQAQHFVNTSISESEFSKRYKGEQVDVIYSKLHPSLAKVVFNASELATYVKIPQEKLSINHLIAILEDKVKNDSILDFLNTINYEWRPNGKAYENKKLSLTVLNNVEERQVVLLHRGDGLDTRKNDFEKSLDVLGYKKKAKNVNGQYTELFFNEAYVVLKKTETDYYSRPNGEHYTQVTQMYFVGRLGDGDLVVD